LDRDYYPADELDERRREAVQEDVDLHIWRKKEIENYLLVPDAISRVIATAIGPGATPPTADAVAQEIDRFSQSLRGTVVDCYGTQIQARDRRLAFASAKKAAEAIVDGAFASQSGRWAVICGKDALSHLSGWSQDQFGVGFGTDRVARELRADEIDEELASVIFAIGAGMEISLEAVEEDSPIRV
jgi:hypothetical protein